MKTYVEVNFTQALEPYKGPDIHQKFAGEDDLLWCERCETHHRRGAPWEVERQRMIEKLAEKVAEQIDHA